MLGIEPHVICASLNPDSDRALPRRLRACFGTATVSYSYLAKQGEVEKDLERLGVSSENDELGNTTVQSLGC